MNDSMRPTHSPSAFGSRGGVRSSTRGVTSSPTLVILLYETMMKLMTEADEAIANGRVEKTRDAICRGLAVIDELSLTLDPAAAPDLAKSLRSVYGFCRARLLAANVQINKNRPADFVREPLHDVVSAIAPLYDAWTAV